MNFFLYLKFDQFGFVLVCEIENDAFLRSYSLGCPFNNHAKPPRTLSSASELSDILMLMANSC